MSFINPGPCEPCHVIVDGEDCCSVTFTGFCLEDGTPIGIVIQDEEQIGWFNLQTGVFTPGPPPPGTEICPPPPLDCAKDSVTVCGLPEGSATPSTIILTPAGSVEVALTERSSEVRGRLHVDAFVENISAFPVTIHTVTPGRIFYLLSIGVMAINSSVTTTGRLVVRDNLTVKMPYLVGAASSSVPGPIAIAPTSFLEPIPFTTDVNIQSLAGVNTVSLYIIGYEE